MLKFIEIIPPPSSNEFICPFKHGTWPCLHQFTCCTHMLSRIMTLNMDGLKMHPCTMPMATTLGLSKSVIFFLFFLFCTVTFEYSVHKWHYQCKLLHFLWISIIGQAVKIISLFINIWFAIRRLNKYILYAKGLSKGMQATQSVKWNEIYKWKDDRIRTWAVMCPRLMWITP